MLRPLFALLLSILSLESISAQPLLEPPRTQADVVARLRAGIGGKFSFNDDGRVKSITTGRIFGAPVELAGDLSWVPLCADLEELSIEDRSIAGELSDASLIPLGELDQLRVLRLGDCDRITDDGLRHLSAVGSLEELALTSDKLTGHGAGHLVMCPRLKQIQVGGDALTDEGIATLAELPRLEVVTLSGSNLTDDALEVVAKLPNLTTVYVGGVNRNFTAAGIGRFQNAKNLRTLHLWDTPIGDDVVPFLSRMGQLQALHLRGTKISEDGIQTLAEALPDVRITSKHGDFGPQ